MTGAQVGVALGCTNASPAPAFRRRNISRSAPARRRSVQISRDAYSASSAVRVRARSEKAGTLNPLPSCSEIVFAQCPHLSSRMSPLCAPDNALARAVHQPFTFYQPRARVVDAESRAFADSSHSADYCSTAGRGNRIIRRTGQPFWQGESWGHYLRFESSQPDRPVYSRCPVSSAPNSWLIGRDQMEVIGNTRMERRVFHDSHLSLEVSVGRFPLASTCRPLRK